MSNKEKQWSIPAVNCPACGRPIMYSSIPHKKGDYIAMLVESSFEDLFLICGKCKSKVRVINISGSVPERKAAEKLGLQFKLLINEQQLI